MTDPSIEHPDWDVDLSDAPIRSRMQRVGAAAGARELGAALYEIDPGGAISPYHLHRGNEELLIVLSGRPRLRTPSGVRELAPGAVVAFVPARIFEPSPVRQRSAGHGVPLGGARHYGRVVI